jgi:hypothetical protein
MVNFLQDWIVIFDNPDYFHTKSQTLLISKILWIWLVAAHFVLYFTLFYSILYSYGIFEIASFSMAN